MVPTISSNRVFDGLGPAGGVLAGTYPNPDFAQPMATTNDVAQKADVVHTHGPAAVTTGTFNVNQFPTSTTSSSTALVRADDPRLSNPRAWNLLGTGSPTPGQVPTWNGTAYAPSTPPTASAPPDASTTTKGVIQLGGDLGGVATAPRVVTRGPIGGHLPATAVGGAVTIDATTGNSFYLTATVNLTVNAPTGPVDGQTVRLEVLASGAARTITLATQVTNATGVARSGSPAAGKIALLDMTYSTRAAHWILTRFFVEP